MKTQTLLLTLLVASFAQDLIAAPKIYQATGYSPEDIAGVVEQFRRDISNGGVNNGMFIGSLPNGWRELTWSDTPVGPIRPLGLLPFGALLTSGPNSAIQTSASYFSDVSAAYAGAFQSFDTPHVAGYFGFRGELGLSFTIPTQQTSFQLSTSHALGAVFSDVDLPNLSGIRIVTTKGEGQMYFAPAAPGDGGLSFIGVVLDPGTEIRLAALQLGNNSLSASVPDGAVNPSSGETTDLVIVDNVIFAEPGVVPEPSALILNLTGTVMLMVAWRAFRRPGSKCVEPNQPAVSEASAASETNK